MALNGRCDCGFVLGQGKCPMHDKLQRNPNKVTRAECVGVGTSVAGVTVVEHLPDQWALVRCECGELFKLTKSALSKARRKGKECKCQKCKSQGLSGKESAA